MLHFNGFNVFLEGLYNKQYPVRTVEFWVEPYPSPVNNNRMTVFAASGLTVSLLDFGVSVQAAADEEVRNNLKLLCSHQSSIYIKLISL